MSRSLAISSAALSWPLVVLLITTSGQAYDMFAATAAHPSLPFGSLLRLTNPKTGQSQLVRINDRGPFWGDRELDVSFLVASRLGIVECGVARLRIELLEEPPLP